MDSDNHKDHVAYPDLVNTGKCPKGFEKRIPSLFYETIWNTNAFKGVDGTFVFANGDPTGYGYHGDFMTGWSQDILKSAIQKCTNPSGRLTDCPVFELQSQADAAKCTYEDPKELKNDQCTGPAKGLCGNVEIQYGPKYASSLVPGKPETPTAKPTTASPTQSQVPTLSHTDAKTQSTNPITVASVKPTAAPSSDKPAPPPAPSKPASSYSAIKPASPSPVKAADADADIKKEAATPIVAAPEPTKAPAVPAQEPKGKVVGTSTYTSAGAIYHVVMEEVEVTVTAPAPAAASPKARARRHAHAHMHHKRDREHGLLRQH